MPKGEVVATVVGQIRDRGQRPKKEGVLARGKARLTEERRRRRTRPFRFKLTTVADAAIPSCPRALGRVLTGIIWLHLVCPASQDFFSNFAYVFCASVWKDSIAFDIWSFAIQVVGAVRARRTFFSFHLAEAVHGRATWLQPLSERRA